LMTTPVGGQENMFVFSSREKLLGAEGQYSRSLVNTGISHKVTSTAFGGACA